MPDIKRIAVTGHRPKDLYSSGSPFTSSSNIKHLYLEAIAHHRGSLHFITGMALGVDTCVAEACIETNTPFTAAVPFPRQASSWPEFAQEHYQFLLSKAHTIHYVSVINPEDRYEAVQMLMARNNWMVANADSLWAMWSGKANGGTFRCIQSALKYPIPVRNLWPPVGYVFPKFEHPF